jgi:hypothetical protein
LGAVEGITAAVALIVENSIVRRCFVALNCGTGRQFEMPVSTGSTVEYPNVKLVHSTKNNSPDEPVQLAFSVVDESGREEVITGFCPTAASLYHLFQENAGCKPELQGRSR